MSEPMPVSRLLVVAQFYPPLGNARAIQAGRAVRAMRELGTDVRVVGRACEPASAGQRDTIYRAVAEAALYLNCSRPALHGARGSLRSALSGQWTPDCVLSMSTPFDSHLLGRAIARRLDSPWAAFLSDPFPMSLAPGPYAARRHKLTARHARRIAGALLADVDALLCPTREMADVLQAAYPGLKGLPSVETLHSADTAGDGAHGPINRSIVHVGELTRERCSEPLTEAIRRYAGEPAGQDKLVFVGRVDAKFRARLAVEEQRGALSFRPPIPPGESLRLMAEAGTLLLIEADMQGSPFLPSKLTDYAQARRPIIIITNPGSALHRLTQGHPGILCVPHDAPQISEALQAANAMADVHADLHRLFDPEAIAQRYLAGIEQAVAHFEKRSPS